MSLPPIVARPGRLDYGFVSTGTVDSSWSPSSIDAAPSSSIASHNAQQRRGPDPGLGLGEFATAPPAVLLQGELLLLRVGGDIHLEVGDPGEVERLVLADDLVGVAVHHVSARDRTDQLVLAQDVAGLLRHLTDRRHGLGLPRIDAAARRDPPPAPLDTRVAVLEQQGLLVRADHDHPHGPPGLAYPVGRIVGDGERAAAVGLHAAQPTHRSADQIRSPRGDRAGSVAPRPVPPSRSEALSCPPSRRRSITPLTTRPIAR